MITTILGPPGTGKTFTLIGKVEDAIKRGIKPERIGYFAFTNRAADEALNRIILGGMRNYKQFPFFRTLHSLAFNQLGLTRSRVFSREAMNEFANWMGLELSVRNTHLDDEILQYGATEDDKTLFLIGLAAVKMVHIDQAFQIWEWDRSIQEVIRIVAGLEKFKRARSLIDFSEMLYLFIDKGPSPDLDVIIVDEAQDLSKLQWAVVEKLMYHNPSAEVWLGGDDDQAIYEWAGADVNTFLAYASSDPVVLRQSFRVPDQIALVARAIIQKIKARAWKSWKAAEHTGSVIRTDGGFRDSEMTGSVLFLARNFHFLRTIAEWLEDEGQDWGYLHQKKAKYQLSTIHGAKGAEADTVILDLSMTRRSYDEIDTDAEKRVWYTAVTRARHCLQIIEPYTRHNAEELFE
jgi:DNA helicase-2/ATP-dependent DNA helicase PcrA